MPSSNAGVHVTGSDPIEMLMGVVPATTKVLDRAGLLNDAVTRAGGIIQPYWTKYTDGDPGTPYRWADDFPFALGTLSVISLRRLS